MQCTAHPRSPSTATYSTWWNSLPTLAVYSPIMPRWSKTWPLSRQSQLLWLPPAQHSVAEPLSSPIEQGWSLCGSHHQHSYVCCGNLGAVPKAHTAAGTLPPEVPAIHHGNILARLRHQHQSSREGKNATHQGYAATSTSPLGWPCRRDGMTPGCPNLWSLANTVKASASSMHAGVDHKDWQTFSSDRV